jgi:hypothetical protein
MTLHYSWNNRSFKGMVYALIAMVVIILECSNAWVLPVSGCCQATWVTLSGDGPFAGLGQYVAGY